MDCPYPIHIEAKFDVKDRYEKWINQIASRHYTKRREEKKIGKERREHSYTNQEKRHLLENSQSN